MKISLRSFLIGILLLSGFNWSWAYSCKTKGAKAEFLSAPNSFLFEVHKVTPDFAEAEVIENYKGHVKKEVQLVFTSDSKNIDSVPNLEAGKKYIIAAKKYSEPSGKDQGIIELQACELLYEADSAKELIKWLHSKGFKKIQKQ